MSTKTANRDYRINGPENRRAWERGLVRAEWYKCPLPPRRLQALSKRRDGPAIRDTLIAMMLLLGTGMLAYRSWGSWWALPAFLAYGTIYASIGDSRWHETMHRTAFKTQWLNTVVSHVAAFMILRQATPWRYSHLRHHREPLIVGRDPEIPLRPARKKRPLLLDVLFLFGNVQELRRLALHCVGRLDAEEADYIPQSQHAKVFWEARAYGLIFLAILALCIHTGSIMPALFVGLPSFYGLGLVLLTGVFQHVGLPEDVLDLRLNSRTVYMNPVVRFLYWNLNYHLDHHMFPSVPFHALPALHEDIKNDCPPANKGVLDGLREVFMILNKQKQDPGYIHIRPLPDGARAYRFGTAFLSSREDQPALEGKA